MSAHRPLFEPSDTPPGLPTGSWDALDSILRRFEEAWRAGQEPSLDDHLPSEGPLRTSALVELIHIDLEWKFKAGKGVRVEHYLQAYPELQSNSAAVVEFILQEFSLQRRLRPTLPSTEYFQRFPHLKDVLVARLPAPLGERQAPPLPRGGPTPQAVVPPSAPTSPRLDSAACLSATLRNLELLESAQLKQLEQLESQFPDARGLANDLVQRDWLTPFQANRLLQGRGEELRLGTYLLLQRLGEGGMGQVFLARHVYMNRVVALKIIKPERLMRPETIKRFQREVRAAAQLNHPNIVLAHDANQKGHTHFLVMEYVEGTDLARLVVEHGPLEVTQACEYVRQAALGLQHAHERGLVHRDIKPSNLLVTPQGVVKVLDLGLARLREVHSESGELTQEGTVMGTPDYIAPEQAEDATRADIRADIYSLGCTLYYLLASQPPFPGGTLMQKLTQHHMHQPKPLTTLRPEVPTGVHEVVQKMMAKKPEQRYQTPAAVAHALEVFTGTLPPLAIPVAPGPQAVPVELNKEATETIGAAPAAVPVPEGTVVAATWNPTSLAANAQDVQTTAPRADSAPARGRQRPAGLASVFASRAKRRWLLVGAAGTGLVLLLFWLIVPSPESTSEQTARSSASPLDSLSSRDIPTEEFGPGMLEGELAKHVVAILGQHRLPLDPPFRVMYPSANRKRVLVESQSASLGVCSSARLRPITMTAWQTTHKTCQAISPDGRIVAWGFAGKIHLWYVDEDARDSLSFKDSGTPVALAFSPQGDHLLSSSLDGKLRIWKLKPEPREVWSSDKLPTPARCLAFYPDGNQVVSGHGEVIQNKQMVPQGRDCTLRLWQWQKENQRPTMQQRQEWKGNGATVVCVLFAPDGKDVLVAIEDTRNGRCTLSRWAMSGGTERPLLKGTTFNKVLNLDMTPDQKYLLVHTDSTIDVVNIDSEAIVRPKKPFPGVFLDNETILAPIDNTLFRWKFISSEKLPPVPPGHRHVYVHDLAFTSDGRYLFSAGGDQSLRIWDVPARKQIDVRSTRSPTFSLALAPDERRILKVDAHEASCWELSSPPRFATQIRREFHLEGQVITNAKFLNRNQILASCKNGMDLYLWDLQENKPIGWFGLPRPLREFGNGLIRLPNKEQWLLIAQKTTGGTLYLADLAEGLLLFLKDGITCASPASDGKVIYYGTHEGKVGLLTREQDNTEQRSFFEWHDGSYICALAASPDGRKLASASRNGWVVLWDVPVKGSPRKITRWHQPTNQVRRMVFAPDGRHLALANSNFTIYIIRWPGP